MVLVIDPQMAGVSGDMFLASLVDLGANKNKIIDGIKKSEKFLPDSLINVIDFQTIQKHGIKSTQLVLETLDPKTRKGSEIKTAIINSAQSLNLSSAAQNFAALCINKLIACESKIHDAAEDSVHFHETSSIDTLVDIIGTALALDDLNLFDEKIICLPISVGCGTVTFSHGTMSNPASAILEIFKDSNLLMQGNDIDTEITTPTGACIISALTSDSSKHYPLMKINSVGYGAGSKDFDSFSNVLKIISGTQSNLQTDTIKILQTNVDDVSGEILGNLIERIMQKGALDASIYHGITKKGRPTNLVTVLCTQAKLDEISHTIISETGTLGIRISDSERLIVPRTSSSNQIQIGGKTFQVNYKKSSFNGKTDFKIEFDDLKDISQNIKKSIKETESLLRKEIEKLENLK